MSRVFTLRGAFEVADNAIYQQEIFDYASPDRRMAWEITGAFFWPITIRGEIGASDGQMNASMSLSTDIIGITAFDLILDPSDNRTCAWGTGGFSIRNGGANDFLAYQSLNRVPELLIDPDVLVTKELHLNFQSTSESTDSPTRKWGYMIVLRERKVSPEQSLFQQIKGMGQDISS